MRSPRLFQSGGTSPPRTEYLPYVFQIYPHTEMLFFHTTSGRVKSRALLPFLLFPPVGNKGEHCGPGKAPENVFGKESARDGRTRSGGSGVGDRAAAVVAAKYDE